MPFNLYSVFNGFKCGDIMNDLGDIMNDLTFQNNYPCYKGLPLEDAELQELTDALVLVVQNFNKYVGVVTKSVEQAVKCFVSSYNLLIRESKS